MGELETWLQNQLLASVFVAPSDPGLTVEELLELGTRRGYGAGELNDAISRRQQQGQNWGPRLLPSQNDATWLLVDFNEIYPADPRDLRAFAFVYGAFEDAARQQGQSRARIQRQVLLERAARAGIDRKAAEVAIASYLLAQLLSEDAGDLAWRGMWAHPQKQVQQRLSHAHPASQALGQVKDICSRRADGRTLALDPMRAFAERLESLGYGDKRIWWEHTLSELQSLDSQTHPTARLVLAAALAEGGLSAIVRYAQSLPNSKAFASHVFEPGKPTNKWYFDELLRAARHPSAGIIDQKLSDSCERLSVDRQRIHFARFVDAPSTAAHLDIRPHEAEAAVETVKRLLTTILEWIAQKQLQA